MIANSWNLTRAHPAPSINDEEKKKVLEEYALFCSKQTLDPKAGDPALLQRITQLETELAKFRTSETASQFTPGDKHLSVDCPKSKAARDVNAWINRVVQKSDQKKITKLISCFQVEHKDMDEDTALDRVRGRLISWGMPVQKAAEIDYDTACKIVAACTLI